MPTRRYVSSVRTAAAAAKRDRVIEAAARSLREDASIATFSLDAVAKAAGVTRLTVYHQFGSRRGLLEAVFDEIARQGGLAGIADVMAMPDPRAALDRLVEIFCAFWSSDPAVGRLHEAMATDPEFAQALIERNERRRKTIDVLVGRIAEKAASPQARQDTVDVIFALTSFAMFAMLGRDRSVDEVSALVKSACRSALDPPIPGGGLAKRKRLAPRKPVRRPS
jgi:AcrR family transcriptional regulator